ncbi:SMI1/KNR4 family protein [Paenibacillus sp. S-38]|uniref:SMI1/KNR4 family protein n=1 Tax=Paenibacillus sp. S-38 TaxID=3416710 RepID=UPI003CE81177
MYRKLLDDGIAEPEEIRGCSEEEVRGFEKENNLRLPGHYRNLLLMAGHGAGRLLRGTDIHWGQVTGLREATEELLSEKSDGDHPAVYLYVEGSDAPRKIYPTFDMFLLEELKLAKQAAKWEAGD